MGPFPEAQRLFAELLKGLETREQTDVEAFISSHPTEAAELRRLYGGWLRALTASSRAEPPGSESAATQSMESSASTASTTVDQVLQRLASREHGRERYRALGELGSGGMGKVTRVWDADLGRDLAMKVIRDVEPRPDGRIPEVQRGLLGRFLDEARVNAQLDHPGIAPIHELGVDAEGRVYFTMKLVKGETLQRTFARVHAGEPEWSLPRALGLIVKVCDAMAYAHHKGVIHRDLKPSNVMVGAFGAVYVMDWGLARVLGEKDKKDLRIRPEDDTQEVRITTHREESDGNLVTMDGDALGTPAFMPPEQASGRLDEIGPASDVYSVGAMLYHLLTGRAPYRESENQRPFQILRRVIAGPPLAVHEIAPDVPAELVAICEKAMARAPEARYASMSAMSDDMSAFIEGRVVRAYETGAVAEFKKWVLRNRGLAASIVAAIALGMGGLTSTAIVQSIGKRNANRNAYLAQITLAATNIESDSLMDSRQRLQRCSPEFRDWEWRHIQLRTDPALFDLTQYGTVRSIAFSPGGDQLAVLADEVVDLWDPRSGAQLRRLAGHSSRISGMGFVAAGSRIVTGSWDKTLRLWDARSGELLRTVDGENLTALECSPDGTLVCAGGKDGSVTLWDAALERSKPLEGFTGRVMKICFDPRSGHFAAGTMAGEVCAWTLSTSGEPERHLLAGHSAQIASLAFSPDGSLLASGDLNGVGRVWDVSQSELQAPLASHQGSLSALAFGPDGGQIAAAGVDGRVRLQAARTGALLLEFDAQGTVHSLAYGPDGSQLAVACHDGIVRTWDPRTGSPMPSLRGHDNYVECVAFSPDGSRIVAGGGNRRVVVWARATGDGYATLGFCEGVVTGVAVNRDSSTIAATERSTLGGALHTWNAASGSPGWSHTSGAALNGVAFSTDATRLLTCSGDGELAVWAAASGEHLDSKTHPGAVLCLAPSPDGRCVATGCADDLVRLWDLDGSGCSVLSGHAADVLVLAFSEDGQLLASGSEDKTVRIWNAKTGAALATLEGHTGPVMALAFQHGDDMLVSGGVDRDLRLWKLPSTAASAVLLGHDRLVTALAFSPSGSRLVSASRDKTARIWDVATRETVARLVHTDVVSALAFSPEGSFVVTGTQASPPVGVNEVRMWLTDRARAQQLWIAQSERR